MVRMAQTKDSRRKSMTEAFVNSFGSYPIGYALGIIVLPAAMGWLQENLLVANLAVTLVYAVASFVRTYYLRRVFERFGCDDNIIRLGRKACRRVMDSRRGCRGIPGTTVQA